MAHTIRSFQSISTVLNRGQDLKQLLNDILEQLVSIVGQERGAVYLFNSREQKLELSVNRGLELPQAVHPVAPDASDYDVIQELDRKSTRLNSSHVRISYAVFCLKK